MKFGASELEWMPDGKRILFANGEKIGIIDLESKKYGYLADGYGWILVKEKS